MREIANTYSTSYIVKLDVNALLADLEKAGVLINTEGNYFFSYQHLSHYFLARYYRDNLGRDDGNALRSEINHMVDHVSNDRLAATLMFTLYFSRDSKWIIDRLILNADQIFKTETPSDLRSDVAFFNEFCLESEIKIPDDVDLEKNRRERRELKDSIVRRAEATETSGNSSYRYSDSLSDSDKLDLAYRHIELLGQVIRNFPGSLPGSEKLAILRSTYLLGLRALRVILNLLASSAAGFQGAMKELLDQGDEGPKAEHLARINGLVARFVTVISTIAAFSTLKKISGSVGLADLEDAYAATLQQVGINNATQLVDLSIKLDHCTQFPEKEIRELHAAFADNVFADNLLKALVLSHIQVFDVPAPLRQSLSSLFKLKANVPLLIDPARKRTKREP